MEMEQVVTMEGEGDRQEELLSRDVQPKNEKAQGKLLEALRTGNIIAFRELLKEKVNVNHKYDGMETLLTEACWLRDRENFVELLLKAGADPNIASFHKRQALHFAASLGDEKTMLLLLENKQTNVNATDGHGNTALHLAAEPDWDIITMTSHRRCIQMLMERDIKINLPNYFGCTALWLAAEQNHKESRQLVQVILECGGSRLNVDIPHAENGITTRVMIEKKYPSLKSLLPQPTSGDYIMNMLISPNPNLIEFSNHLRPETVNRWIEDPYYCTYLEMACRRKELDENVLKELIKMGANTDPVHDFQRNFFYPMLHQAVMNTNYKAVKMLIKLNPDYINVVNKFGTTALHMAARQHCSSEEERDMKKCVHRLLGLRDEHGDPEPITNGHGEAKSPPRIDVDASDVVGTTALHDATDAANLNIVLSLLNSGANLMAMNDEGKRPLDSIDATTLANFLDEQVTSNHRFPQSKDCKIEIRYSFLYSKNNQYEMDTVYHISRSNEHRHLLRHPVIKSFLDLKWHLIYLPFYIHLVMYILFTLLFTSYVLITCSNHCSTSNCTVISSNSSAREDNSSVEKHSQDASFIALEYSSHIMQVICFILLTLLVLYELLQCSVNFKRYITDWENIFELFTFTICFLALCDVWALYKIDLHASAMAILLVWVELVLFSGRMPILSIQLEMLKKVSFTFIRFMAWYSLLIVAFALSFYILFGREKQGSPEVRDFLQNPGLAVLKTIIMMVGELNASDLKFEEVPVTSHVLFLTFVLFIVIVLLNLLNGLAVSDTKAIQDDAKILSLVSMIKLISYWDMMLLSIGSLCFRKEFFQNHFEPKLRVFKTDQLEKKIELFRANRKVSYPTWSKENTRITRSFEMEQDIISDVTSIILERKKFLDNEEMKNLIKKLHEKLEKIETTQHRDT